ncbi:MAG: DUF1015 domain-containing protein, partial [Gemmatimonadales bacterium]
MGSSPPRADLAAPFRGERYADTQNLSRVIAPPYDVIDPAERARLAAADAHNIVHLLLPEGSDDGRYARAAGLLADWRRRGVLVRDPAPAVYVLAQDFTLRDGEPVTRRGVLAAVAAEGYEPQRVRPHERTHAGPKADRLALLRAIETNVEALFMIAPDRERVLADALATVMGSGPADGRAELDGVASRVWVVRGDAVERFPLPTAPLYIADGHHRYETATAYAREHPAAARVLSLIVPAGDPGLSILPTHRVIFGTGRDLDRMLERWR